MTGDDWLLIAFIMMLFASIASSAYLWFSRGPRYRALTWLFYSIRALCGLFIFATGVFALNVLIGHIATSDVILFVGFFFVLGVICVVPWGLLSGKRNPKIQEQV